MKQGLIKLLLIVATLMTTACAPMLRMSPNQDTVILLPESSKAVTTEHFRRRESQNMWLFAGPSVVPTDYLAQIAPNQAVRNVRFKQEIDYGRYFLTLALATAAGVATALYAPDDLKPYGLLVYFGIGFLTPQQINTDIEGDIAEPPADLGQGR